MRDERIVSADDAEIEAKRYEGKIKNGNILISVHAESSKEISRAKEIFQAAGAKDICVSTEASTKGTEPAHDQRDVHQVAVSRDA